MFKKLSILAAIIILHGAASAQDAGVLVNDQPTDNHRNYITISHGNNFYIDITGVDMPYPDPNISLTNEHTGEEAEVELSLYGTGGNPTWSGNSAEITEYGFGNYSITDAYNEAGDLEGMSDISGDTKIEIKNSVEGSGVQRWYNAIMLNDVSAEQAAYISGVAHPPLSPYIETVPDRKITAKELSDQMRAQAINNGWLEEATNRLDLISDYNVPAENEDFYVPPYTPHLLPFATPNIFDINEEDVSEYENIEAADDCYNDVAYRPPPYEGLPVPSVTTDINTANQEPYSCPGLSNSALPEEEASLENPMTYCPEGMSEDACLELRIRPTCEQSSGPLCTSMVGEGEGIGAEASLWERYCANHFDESPIGLSLEEKIACIGGSYNQSGTTRDADLTDSDVIQSFCEDTPLATYNSTNNMCDLE